MSKLKHRINKDIIASKVKLILEGAEPRLISVDEALKMAQEQNLDLVEVSSNVVPPICKLMNYGKFIYMQSKQERLHKAKQKKVETKSIRISLKIEKHDMQVKADKIERFIEEGNKVTLELVLRGREKAFFEEGKKKLDLFLALLSDNVIYEQAPKKTPYGYHTLLAKKR